ncbi:hypothetical protein CVV67_05550 [Arthrobacter stackebrandtii]|nr:hypothetical protein CVV67_05550 [Arthrobacter stackebrandtii]
MVRSAAFFQGEAILLAGMPWAKPPVALPGLAVASSHALIGAGDLLTVHVYVFNSTASPLSGLVLQSQSLTNAGMENLRFASCPSVEELALPELEPGAFESRTFTYRVTERDTSHGGLIIAALAVLMDTPEGLFKVAEADALAEVHTMELAGSS